MNRIMKILPSLILIGILAAGCGGGGGGGGDAPAQVQPPPSGPVSVLTWDPPGNYADNAALDPYQDLEHYEVYVRQDGDFNDNDAPVAIIAAVLLAPGSGGKTLEKEFILENIQPFIPAASRHYVSMKAVGIDGQKSRFMPSVAWDKI